MSGRLLTASLAVALAACVPGGPVHMPLGARGPAAAPAVPAPSRIFHGSPDDGFWVSHGPDLDRIVSGGARLEVAPDGEVRASAWDVDFARRNDSLLGGLAVPARLGGGFVFWTRNRLYRAREFTGSLEPIATGLPPDAQIRGARDGISSVFVLTEYGPRELLPGATRLVSAREPGLVDLVALGLHRGLSLDAFGRVHHLLDGGTNHFDLSRLAGTGVRGIFAGENDLWIDTWAGRFLVTPRSALEPADPVNRSGNDKATMNVWKGTRMDGREGMPWGLHESSPLQTALASGAAVGDGTAFGAVPGGVLRVDLATGKLREVITDWFSQGLSCQPVRAPDGVLFACVWERSQGYGGYVLRSIGGAPPELEHSFSDDGVFVADDEGALGYVGSCRAVTRYIDPEDQSRYEAPSNDGPQKPVFCVRRAPVDGGAPEWLERRIEPGEGGKLAAWVPRVDGSAAAIVLASDPLPPPASEVRSALDTGVRVVRVHKDIPGWSFRRPEWRPDRGGLSGYVERRFQAHDDGSIDGWLLPSEGFASVAIGVTIDANGLPHAHDGAPDMFHVITGGNYAVAFAGDGDLYESTDHGRTFRLTGKSPTPPPSNYVPVGCSALGCSMGSTARLGWGDGALTPRVFTETIADPPPRSPASLPHLACSAPPGALPVAMPLPPPAPSGARHTVNLPWGDTLEIVRDAAAPEPAQPPSPATAMPPPVPTASASASAHAPPKKPPHSSPAVRRTHSLLVRLPFTSGPSRRLDATDASFNAERRAMVAPLLSPSGEVEILLGGDQRELVIAADKITVLPSLEGRRWSYGESFDGLLLGGSRVLVLGEQRRRLTLEEHGPTGSPPPVFLGMDREQNRRRPLALGRRDDGTFGLLVLDGPAPETAGLALLDRAASSPSPIERLASWATLVTADDPRCKKGTDPSALHALVLADPSLWLTSDPGMDFGRQGLFLVRWGRERVCLEAMDAAVMERHRRGDAVRSWSLVARWGEGKDRGAALRSSDLRQALVCKIEPRKGP